MEKLVKTAGEELDKSKSSCTYVVQSDSDCSSSEDEDREDYRKGGYHPVRIGDFFKKGQYVVQSKLGWGQFSTVWLSWDTQQNRYVALKLQKSAQPYTEAALREITLLNQIGKSDPEDKKCVLKLLDYFKHTGPNGQHVCLVFEFLGNNLLTLIKYYDYKGLPLQMVKEICFHVLVGLDYLHRTLSIIHTDLKPENILLLSNIDPGKDPRRSGADPVVDKSTANSSAAVKDDKNTRNQKKKLRKLAKRAAQGCTDALQAETKQGNSNLRKSRKQQLLSSLDLRCKIVDFGSSCWTYKQFASTIQTKQYKCPEVLLGCKYSTSADIWSFACVVFELATGDVLFDPHGGGNYGWEEDHLALMTDLLGRMPTNIALGGKYSAQYFKHNGDLRHVPQFHFWPLNKVLQGKYNFCEQDANDLRDFLVPLLHYDPEKRTSAGQALLHPWINSGPRLLQPSLLSQASEQPPQNCDDDVEPVKEKKKNREVVDPAKAAMRNMSVECSLPDGYVKSLKARYTRVCEAT